MDDWQRFQKNNPAIADSILYTKDKLIISDYVSKHNLTCEKQITLLMITNKEKEGWQYLAVKKLLALLQKNLQTVRVIYCLNCLNSFRTENKLKSYKKVCQNKDFCRILLPSKKVKY